MARLQVRPKIDVAFKKIFADNKDLLRVLISHALSIDFKDIELRPTEVTPSDVGEKFCRLDIRAVVDGQEIDIEIQLGDRADYRARAVYYWALLFTHLKSGEDYDQTPRTIVINFVNFNMFGVSDYHSVFQILEKSRHELLSDKAEWHFFELKKIPKIENSKLPLDYWLNLINAETEEDIQALEKVQDDSLQKAVDEVKRMNKDEKFVTTVQAREQRLYEEHSALSAERRKGEQLGEDKGVEKVIAVLRQLGHKEEQIGIILENLKRV